MCCSSQPCTDDGEKDEDDEGNGKFLDEWIQEKYDKQMELETNQN